MIAVILLIAFTIGVGGLVNIFATSLTTTSTGIASNQSEALSKCAGAWINVYSVQSDKVLFSNPSQETIRGINVIVSGGNITPSSASLAPGATSSFSGAGWALAGNTSVTVRGLCQTLVTVEGKCTTSQECWDA